MRFVILSLLALSICSCKNDPNAVDFSNPESVVRAYYDAMSEFDFTKATQYCTKESFTILAALGAYTNRMNADERQSSKAEAKKQYKPIQTVTCTDESSGVKICTTCCDSVGQALHKPLTLKKEYGRWLIDFFE